MKKYNHIKLREKINNKIITKTENQKALNNKRAIKSF